MGYVSKDEVKAALDAAGIEYDADATREELVAMMPDDAPQEAPKGSTVKMRLLRDYWPTEGERLRKNTIIKMDVEEAMDGMERGFVARAK